MSSDSNAQGCKVVLLGDSGVGKTCIISRYITGNFEKNSVSTNGASYCSKNVEYKKLGKHIFYQNVKLKNILGILGINGGAKACVFEKFIIRHMGHSRSGEI